MKKRFLLKSIILLFALVVGSMNAWADDENISCSSTSPYFTGTNFTITYGKNSGNDPVYNSTDRGLRLYVNNYLTITPNNGETITTVTLTVKCNQGGSGSNKAYPESVTVNNGNITAGGTPGANITNITWSGSTTSALTFTVNGAKGNVAVKSISITYTPVTPSYTITAQCSPTTYGSVSLSGATITATPNEGYRVSKTTPYSVSPDGSATVAQSEQNPNIFTVTPSHNTTVTINFEAIPQYPIHWNVNGSTVQTDEVVEGANITFPSSITGVPAGLELMGWVGEEIDGTQSTAPTYVTEATATAEKTYYAVMAVKGGDETVTLTASHTTNSTNYAVHDYTDNHNNTWSGCTNEPYENNVARIGLNNDASHYLGSPEFLGNVKSIIIMTYNGSNSDRTFYLKSSTESTATQLGTVAAPKNTPLTAEQTATLGTTPFKKFYIYASGAVGFSYVKVNYIIYSDYCTSVTTNTFTTAGDWNDKDKWSLGVVPSFAHSATINAACTIPNNCLAQINTITYGEGGSITIEDGGQLICNNSVYVTMQKSIGAWDATNQKGWYTLSTPVNNGTGANDRVTFMGDNPDVTNVVYTNSSSQPEYNVYYYDEATHEWVNNLHGSGFQEFENGHGYIYRRGAAETIEFKGNVNVNAVACDLTYNSEAGTLKGFNLLGNPFTHDITWANFSSVSNVETDGYYLLNEDPNSENCGKWSASASTTATIAPMQAFFVQANDDDPTLTINNAEVSAKSREYNDNIMFSVKNSKHSDEAYVFFKEGHGLNKIEHRNADIPMLYIINNDENFAIADMSADTKVINLGFQAKTIGQYKLSYEAEGDYSYMHLIDRLTGEDVDLLLEGEYSFTAAPSDNDNRFIIRLEDAANAGAFEDQSFVFQNGNDIIVNGNGELQVFDVMGRMIATQHVEGVQTIEKPSTTGVYMFKLNGNVQKVVVR